MGAIEFSGKTVEDALTQASIELGVTSDEIDYEVIEKGSSGILGFGSKDATIRAAKKSEGGLSAANTEASDDTSNEASDNAAKEETVSEPAQDTKKADSEVLTASPEIDTAKSFLADVFKAMDLEVDIDAKFDPVEREVSIDLAGPNMGVIIGKRGQTLDAVQYLTNLAVNKKTEDYTKVKVDTEDYRRRRRETLESLAKNVAYRVKRSKKSVALEAMNPYERRIIHFALQNDNYVTTYSEGDEPYRHVVVALKK
ncbi:MAG: protein jag [Lachnospiraceae bacterium]|nr:protein jag [Lachnospiraceae bacterium]